nr:trypsin-like peptidase domain-containing protein [Solobacterium sp.]
MSTKKLLSRVLKGLTMLAMVFALFVPFVGINAQTTANEAVNDDRNGVIQVRVIYVDDNNNEWNIQSGSGFLISENYVVTAHHVVYVTDDTIGQMTADGGIAAGKKAKDVRNKIKYAISVLRDNSLPATIETSSEELDFAVLNLQKPLKNKKILPIRTTDVQNTENCYALGFPGAMTYFKAVETYTSNDVTIESGKVSNAKKALITGNSIADYVTHSATTTEGMSGGPLVDEDGNVIGVIKGAISENFDAAYFYAVEISQLVEVFDMRGIEYTPAGAAPQPTEETIVDPEPEPEPVAVNTSKLERTLETAKAMVLTDYKDGAAKDAFTKALADAEEALDSDDQTAVDDANDALKAAITALEADLKKGGGFPLWAIIAIAAALVLAIVIFALTRKKPA